MNLTDINALIRHVDPVEMPVSELLTGMFDFSIPSYQRGYRWESSESEADDGKESKQVDDLLDDLTSFVKANSGNAANYYLQPLMVKPRRTSDGKYVWEVLDGQQRLTTMLLLLTCINEKLYSNSPFKLYSLTYQNRRRLDFSKITFNPQSPDYDYPLPTENLDSYYVKKAKDRIERWYNKELRDNQSLQDKFKETLFYQDASRGVTNPPQLRAKFIWYNVEPIVSETDMIDGNRLHDIEVFNRLNRGKISLTDSELIKALFLLCIKVAPKSESSLMDSETLVRKWDEMGRKFQEDGFWKMISPNDNQYGNRMDLLFDFIKDCEGSDSDSSYRYYYSKMHSLLTEPDLQKVEELWSGVKRYFDVLCKWHENVHKHNFIGFLVENGEKIADIYKQPDLQQLVRNKLGYTTIDELDDLTYNNNFEQIRRSLLLFNVLTYDKFGRKFPFNLYRDNSYDVEHVNSQTDNPIEKIQEKTEWVKAHALPYLLMDRQEKDTRGKPTEAAKVARELIIEGILLLKEFRSNGKDNGNKFKSYRSKVENYYACGDTDTAMANKDCIGNLTLLNSSINREYKNALFPKKLRTIKRSDQEGAFIPLCTKYMFLKYYSNSQENPSAFKMMRWRDTDQRDYTQAIKETIKTIL